MLASLKGALALSKVGCPDGLQSRDALDAAIRLERARVDRNEHAFSLVVFDACDLEANAAVTQSLVRSLNDRIRSTDKVGWFGDHGIGVLLPYTSREGAQKFVDDVIGSVDAGAVSPKHTIHSYPSHWHRDDSDGGSGQLHFTDVCGKWDAADPCDPSSVTGHSIDTMRPATTGTSIPGLPVEGEDSTDVSEARESRPLPTWKRLMDIIGSSFGLALISPFLLVHTVIIKIVSPGPVFFRQNRIGYMGRPFRMWKLRTMGVSVDTTVHQKHVSQLINGANKGGSGRPMVKLDNDPNIIPFAIILRKMCLDELPQLINVLRGEMSLVGPRPPLEYEVEEFLKWQHKRFDAVPGMTGLWQVSGKNRLTFSKMIRLDIQYSMHKTFLLDLMILLKTPLAIVSQIRDSLVLQRKRRLMVEGKHV